MPVPSTVRPDPPAKTRGEAIDRYRHRLQLSLGLVTQGQWYVGRSPGSGDDENTLVITTTPWPVRIVTTTQKSIYLSASQRFTVGLQQSGPHSGQWKVTTKQYIYSLGDSDDPNDAWIHWHWHPPKRDHPHIHIASGDPDATLDEGIRGRHIPSGRVSLEALVRYLVDDCDVEPREGGRSVLDENEELFRRYRSWG